MEREPCPWRMIDDAGGGFAFGMFGGGIWHFFGGYINSPKGVKLRQGFGRMQVRAPNTAGSFAIWGTIFSCFDCAITTVRKKEDPWNAILSGAATGGFLAMRGGLASMGRNALFGGIILAAMEGVGIAFTRVVMPYFEKKTLEAGQPVDLLEPPIDPIFSRRNATPITWNTNTGFDVNTAAAFQEDNSNSSSNDNSTNSTTTVSSWKWW